jgi:hypothetical protein
MKKKVATKAVLHERAFSFLSLLWRFYWYCQQRICCLRVSVHIAILANEHNVIL